MFESVFYYIAGAADKRVEQFINPINDIRIKMMIRFCKLFIITAHCVMMRMERECHVTVNYGTEDIMSRIL